MFSSNIITARKAEQTNIELNQSMTGLNTLIRESVDSITNKDTLILDWYRYIDQLRIADSKHTEFHVELLSTLRKDVSAMIDTILVHLILDSAMTYSYVDLDVLAYKLGTKIINKSMKSEPTLILSLGLNIINFVSYAKLAQIGRKVNQEKHLIYTIIVNPALMTKEIQQRARQVRAGAPMMCAPIEHTPDAQGGYMLNQRTMLKGVSTHQTQSQPVCDALNKLQNVAYELRTNLPMFKQYLDTDRFMAEDGITAMVKEQMKMIDDVQFYADKFMYFPVACDDRGRVYECSSYIKYQGDKYQKAMLQFESKEVLTPAGMDMLRVAIANELYTDKCNVKDALAWFDLQSMPMLVKLAQDNPIAQSLMDDYRAALNNEPIGTITHWDATNSGLQIYSLLGADAIGASLCNVLDRGVIADAYQALADSLNTQTEGTSFNRSNVKKAFMTFLYGAMDKNILFKINDPKNGVTAGIAEFFPSDWDETTMWDTFNTAMTEIAPSAIKLMHLIYKYNRADRSKYNWTMPDGFKVEVTRSELNKVTGWRLDLDGKTHEGSINTYVERGSAYSRALAPDIIHSIDAYVVREVARRAGFQISAIHDSFGCHPNNVAALMTIVKSVYADILEMDLLTNILSQLDEGLTDRAVKKGWLDKGTLTKTDVMNSTYIIR